MWLALGGAAFAAGCHGGGAEAGNEGMSGATQDDAAGTDAGADDDATASGGGEDSSGGDGSMPPVGGHHGILDCPTTPLPDYGIAASVDLSERFAQSCASCHGSVGQGKDNYPAIPGLLDEAGYIAKVRSGANAMPPFGPDYVTDAELAADYASLVELAGQPGGVAEPTDGPAFWTDTEVEEIYQRGLAVWRKPGVVDGQACANCHSPDGVELAIIGFADDAILRRSQMHVGPEDALVLRDFVHAQRRRLDIAETCSTDWRPFQPGGTVLPGDTANEQDVAFLTVLEDRELLLATGKVVTLDDAKQAFAELQAVDLRRLPIGIALPRLTEDMFNGPEHRDINDYMPPVPTAPNDAAAYFAVEDAYLADPTDVKLYELLELNRTSMNDLGYVEENSGPSNPASNCPFPTTTSWIMDRVTHPKRLSVFVAAHLFREELRQPGSFYDRPLSPFPDAPAPANPAFTLGGFAIEPPCYDRLAYPDWIAAFPEGFRAEFPQQDLDAGAVENATDRVTHVWMMLGQVLDPTLISTDDMQSNKLHYWASRNFAQREVHLPFVYAHRLAVLAEYWTEFRGTPEYPQAGGPFDHAGEAGLHPLLANDNQQAVTGLASVVDPADADLPAADVNRFKGNVIRMLLLLSREQLQQGMAVEADQNYDHCLSVICQVEQTLGYVDGLQGHAEGLATQGFDLELYEADTRILIGEVVDLMNAAPQLE